MSRKRLATFLLVLASTFVGVLLVEVPGQLGMVDYPAIVNQSAPTLFMAARPWRNPTMRVDVTRIFRRRGRQHLVGTTRGDIAQWMDLPGAAVHQYDARYDASGFRNADTTEAASVAVIGDSFIESPLVHDSALLTTRLATLLDKRVLNFGHLGYGPQQELDVLLKDVAPRRVQVVVWAVFEGNDLADLAGFDAQRSGWALRSRVYRTLAYSVYARLRSARFAVPETDRARLRMRLVRGQLPASAGDSVMLFVSAGPRMSPREDTLLNRLIGVLAVAQDSARSRGVAFLVALVPTRYRVYQGIARFTPDSGLGLPSDLPRRFLDRCRTSALRCVDLTPALQTAAGGGPPVYFIDDAHWNSIGSAVAARTIADELRQGNLLAFPAR